MVFFLVRLKKACRKAVYPKCSSAMVNSILLFLLLPYYTLEKAMLGTVEFQYTKVSQDHTPCGLKFSDSHVV